MGIQLGIVGYGGMGGFHHRNASKIEGVQVVGAYDIDPVRVQVAEESGSGIFVRRICIACEDTTRYGLPCRTDCHMEVCIASVECRQACHLREACRFERWTSWIR